MSNVSSVNDKTTNQEEKIPSSSSSKDTSQEVIQQAIAQQTLIQEILEIVMKIADNHSSGEKKGAGMQGMGMAMPVSSKG
jgi:hypothetical protein